MSDGKGDVSMLKDGNSSSNSGEIPLTVDSADVVKLILQYLKENSLLTCMHQLQKDTGISLNTVDNIEQFQNDIRNGRWDSVLHQISTLKLPVGKCKDTTTYCDGSDMVQLKIWKSQGQVVKVYPRSSRWYLVRDVIKIAQQVLTASMDMRSNPSLKSGKTLKECLEVILPL
eukprot:gene13112-14392_t